MGRRSFTKEFKLGSVKLVTEQGYTQSEAATRLGIEVKNLSRWIKESRQEISSSKGVVRFTRGEQEELQQLRKEVKRLRMERDILKKAMGFFATESN